MTVIELYNKLSEIKDKDKTIVVFTEGDIYPIECISFIDFDNQYEIGCGWNKIEEDNKIND
jgi:hypothetical protein